MAVVGCTNAPIPPMADPHPEASHPGRPYPDEVEPAPLIGSFWRLTELVGGDGFRVNPRFRAHLVLDEDRVTGSSGCNRLIGRFTAEGDTLRFRDLGGTRMACEADAMELERRFLAALETVSGYTITGEQLVLNGPNGPLARFERYLE
ncbi:MAG TPA: META domain-containing protein [Pseudomonadales bacterium]